MVKVLLVLALAFSGVNRNAQWYEYYLLTHTHFGIPVKVVTCVKSTWLNAETKKYDHGFKCKIVFTKPFPNGHACVSADFVWKNNAMKYYQPSLKLCDKALPSG